MIFLRKKKKEKKIPMPRAAVGVASALGVYLTPLRPPVTASAVRRRPFYAEGCRRRRGGIRRGYHYAIGQGLGMTIGPLGNLLNEQACFGHGVSAWLEVNHCAPV